MADEYKGLAVGTFEYDLMVPCLAAMDAAAKAADVQIEAVERNRLKSGVCVKMRGSISDVRAAMEAAIDTGDRAGGKLLTKNIIARPTDDTDKAIRNTMYT